MRFIFVISTDRLSETFYYFESKRIHLECNYSFKSYLYIRHVYIIKCQYDVCIMYHSVSGKHCANHGASTVKHR